MPKLKGLLDSARAKIGGLLGDFPQGFNAGAVAGVAGYPGDIAFMLDTAGRALTGQDTQPAAQDFPGTTEYIANKAGYPVPQSFSGQLGAAIGGVLTPGPGDLAKFAPVLSAALPSKAILFDGVQESVSDFYRATANDKSPMAGAAYAMFAEGSPERVRHYGSNLWSSSGDGAVDVASIQKDIVKALRRSGVMQGEHGTAAQLAREANPDNIVNSAGLWDRPDLVEIIYNDVLEPKGISSVRTSDGLIMFDSKGAKLLERNGEPIKAAEDFAARRAGKAKPYKEAVAQERARNLQDIVSQYEAQGLKLNAYENASNPDLVTLSRIQVPEAQRGQGIGSQAMEDLIKYADENGKTVALSPSADFGGNVNRLREFYKRFGFIDNKGRSKDFSLSESMYRKPGAQ